MPSKNIEGTTDHEDRALPTPRLTQARHHHDVDGDTASAKGDDEHSGPSHDKAENQRY